MDPYEDVTTGSPGGRGGAGVLTVVMEHVSSTPKLHVWVCTLEVDMQRPSRPWTTSAALHSAEVDHK